MIQHLFLFYFYFALQFPHFAFSLSESSIHTLNWTALISDSPIVSSPFLLKSHGGSDQLIATTLDGSVTIINTATGEQKPPWPAHFTDKSFYAGPLMYDINQDGSMDILLTSSDGEIMFLAQNGTVLHSQTIFLPRLLVKRKWNIIPMDVILNTKTKTDTSPSGNTMFLPRFDDNQSNLTKLYVPMETHILSTPVIGDFNGDGINSELIIPVNYYFEDDIKKDHQRLKSLSLNESEVDSYLANGIIVVDLRTRETVFNITLELTMKSSAFPAYLLSSPVVIDLDGTNSESEVIIGSMSGKTHVYNKAGKYAEHFELSDVIHGEIGVGDVDNDGKPEIIVVDGSGNVFCYDDQKVTWEAMVSGTITAGVQLVDMNHDDKLEVVIATNDGYLWILDGQTGHILPNWPLKLGDEIHSKVMFRTHLDNSVDIIVMADGNMHIVNIGKHTQSVIQTEVLSYVPVIYDQRHDAFIVSTTGGKILSFQNQNEETINFTTNQQTGIRFVKGISNVITTAQFAVQFEIYDKRNAKLEFYNVTIHFPIGISYLVYLYEATGVFSVMLHAPQSPKKSYVLLELCNKFRECTEDVAYFTFYPKTKDNLVLYVLLPFLVMVALLLVLHGYPDGNLLPVWETTINSD